MLENVKNILGENFAVWNSVVGSVRGFDGTDESIWKNEDYKELHRKYCSAKTNREVKLYENRMYQISLIEKLKMLNKIYQSSNNDCIKVFIKRMIEYFENKGCASGSPQFFNEIDFCKLDVDDIIFLSSNHFNHFFVFGDRKSILKHYGKLTNDFKKKKLSINDYVTFDKYLGQKEGKYCLFRFKQIDWFKVLVK